MNHYAELQAAKHCLEQMRQAILHLHNRMNFGGGIHVVDVIQRLEEIAAIGEDNPIQIPPEYRDETDEAVRDAPPDNLCDHCKNYEQECLNAGNKAVTDPADCAFYAPPDAPLCQHCKTPLPDHYVAVYSNANDCTKYCSEECAVAAGASGLLERPNGDAPPDEPVTPPDWRGESCHNQWDAPPDVSFETGPLHPKWTEKDAPMRIATSGIPDLESETARCINDHADYIQTLLQEIEILKDNTKWVDAAAATQSDAPHKHQIICKNCDGSGRAFGRAFENDPPAAYACEVCSGTGKIAPPSNASPDAPMRPVALDNSYSQRNNHYHCLHSHADAIERLDNASAREAKRWRLKYNDLQQQIDALKTDPLTGRPPDSEEWQRLNEMRQKINSHTAIVHGEIERRLSEMGQKIAKLDTLRKIQEPASEDAPPDAPMRPGDRKSRSTPSSNSSKVILKNHADAIEKMQRELEVGRANDRYFNEKLDYIGEMKEEMGQQIDIQRNEINAHQSQIDANRNSLQDLIANRTVDPADVDHDAHAEAHRKMQQQIDKLEQLISGEKGDSE